MAEIDWSDPCAALAQLRPAYYALLSGQQVAEVRHNGKAIVHHRSRIGDLALEIRRLEIACAKKQGTGGARFAITAG